MKKYVRYLIAAFVLLALLAVSVSAIDADHWAVDYVDFSIYNYFLDELRSTVTATELISRKEIAWGLINAEEIWYTNDVNPPFDDVAYGTKYSGPIHWVNQNGIITGHSDGLFHPDDPIRRQDMALVIYRYLVQYAGVSLPNNGVNNTQYIFTDYSSIDSYARSAVEALYDAGIVTGADNSQFNPHSYVTMVEAACFFTRAHGYRFVGNNSISVYVKTESGLPVLNAAVAFCPQGSSVPATQILYQMTDSDGFATLSGITQGESYGINAMSQFTCTFSTDYVPATKLHQIMTLPTNVADYDLTASYNRASFYPHVNCKETSWAFPSWCPTRLMERGQNFGWRYNSGVEFHQGMDYGCSYETIYNTTGKDLIVNYSGNDYNPNTGKSEFGNYIKVRVKDTEDYLLFMHLSSYSSVPKYGIIPPGGIIGVTGNTGSSTGPHLHLQLVRGNETLNWTDEPELMHYFYDPRIYFE